MTAGGGGACDPLLSPSGINKQMAAQGVPLIPGERVMQMKEDLGWLPLQKREVQGQEFPHMFGDFAGQCLRSALLHCLALRLHMCLHMVLFITVCTVTQARSSIVCRISQRSLESFVKTSTSALLKQF